MDEQCLSSQRAPLRPAAQMQSRSFRCAAGVRHLGVFDGTKLITSLSAANSRTVYKIAQRTEALPSTSSTCYSVQCFPGALVNPQKAHCNVGWMVITDLIAIP